MSLTDTQIDNFILELRNFSPVLERSEQPQNWSLSLHEDYAEKGNLLERLIEINIALLRELNQLQPQTGSAEPNGSIISNRGRLFIRLTATENDRQIWFNPDIGVDTGWLLVAERRA